MKIWIASSCSILIALIMPPNRVMGQREKPWQFSEALRAELDTRLHAFTEAQADGDWNTVDQMLGKYRRGGNYLEFTPSHRACLIDEMRRYPMVRFKVHRMGQELQRRNLEYVPGATLVDIGGRGDFSPKRKGG